jgi:hypothetical protein
MVVEEFFEWLTICRATSSCHDTSGFRKTSDAQFSTSASDTHKLSPSDPESETDQNVRSCGIDLPHVTFGADVRRASSSRKLKRPHG